jgi:hypothetical protein
MGHTDPWVRAVPGAAAVLGSIRLSPTVECDQDSMGAKIMEEVILSSTTRAHAYQGSGEKANPRAINGQDHVVRWPIIFRKLAVQGAIEHGARAGPSHRPSQLLPPQSPN